MSTDRYTSPLSERYASKEMQYIFSQDMKFSTWRKLWIALAETEMELGLSENGKPVITQDMIDEMKEHVNDINYDVAVAREKLVRHDVMSHVYAYGQQCPKAAGIIHLGATSCYVGDNTDIIIMNEALKLVHKKLVSVIAELVQILQKNIRISRPLHLRISSRHSDNSRKACNTLDTGVSDGSGGSGVCTEYVKTARIERNDWYTGKFPGTF